jgi:tetratricopeptide (TPR) repeat protein
MFVGRTAELQVLRQALTEGLAGRSRVVLLAGEPGIGKTRLAELLAHEANQQGAFVAWGRCYEGDGAPALWPWAQVLRASTAELDIETACRLAAINVDDLAHLLPHLSCPAGAPSPTVFESPQTRFRLFDSIVRLLNRLTAQKPMVLVLDDLQGADSASLLLLQFAARVLRDARLLIVGTYRHAAAESALHLGEMVAELLREATAEYLLLKGLSATDIAEYIHHCTGVVPPSALVSELLRRTDGNALFVAEFVRVWLAEGGLCQSGEGAGEIGRLVPDRLRALIEHRLAPLSVACRELLIVAATVGHEFPLALVDRVFCAGSDASDSFIMMSAIHAEARRAGIVVAAPKSATWAAFSHAVMRDIVYDSIPTNRRQELHRAVAVALEQLPDRDDHLAELALHFSQAGDEAAQAKALDYARQAAAQAAARTAYAEATQLYETALHLNDAIAPINEARRCDLLLALGHVRHAASEIAAARASFQHAAESARRLAAAGRQVEAGDYLARAAIGYAGGWAGVGNIAQFDDQRATAFDPEAVNLLEEARAALGHRDSALGAYVLSQLAVQRHFVRSSAECDNLSRRAVDLARRVGDPATLGYVRCVDWVVGWSPDNADERLVAAGEIVACAEQVRDRSLAVGGHFYRIAALLELGDAETLRRETSIVTRLAAELRQPQWLWRARAHRIMLALLEGRFDTARELLRESRDDRLHDDGMSRLFIALQMNALQREQGRPAGLEAAATLLKMLIDQNAMVPSLRTRLAYLYVQLERPDEAASELAHLAANDFTDFPRNLTYINALAEAAEVCTAAGDKPLAASLYERLRPYGQRHVVFLGGALSWGSVSRLLGQLAATIERWDDAAAHFETALTANGNLGARTWVAYTHYAYGSMLLHRRAPGDVDRARYSLEQAAATAQTLGMRALAARIPAWLQVAQDAGAGASLPSRPPAVDSARSLQTDAPVANLFRQEGDFWTVAYDGVTIRLKDAKGLHYLVHLLRHPGQEFHALEIAAPSDESPPLHRRAATGVPLLDAQAKADYKLRLVELREVLTEAERNNDLGRSQRARAEMESLAEQMAAAVGLGGRDRQVNADAERARLTVTKGIKTALEKIRASHPALARHLAVSVNTGYFCSYTPDASRPTDWQL